MGPLKEKSDEVQLRILPKARRDLESKLHSRLLEEMKESEEDQFFIQAANRLLAED